MSSWEPPQPPPGQEPSGQDPSGQDPFGQQPPQGGQPSFGQPPAGPPQYGQPQYGQPQYGQPQYPQQPPPPPQYGAFPPAPPAPYAAPAPVGPPGATGPLNIGNRVVAFIIDAAIFLVLEVIVAVSGSTAIKAVFYLIVLAVAIYFIYLVGSVGQTPGKKIMGVKIVDASSGQTIGFGRAFLRELVQGLCNIVCFAGLWSAFLDSGSGRYQGWHDKAISTQVISVK
jgi:uncharacterized RDD family membrane protein YckC